MSTDKVIALIPARGGSRGLRHKNIKLINNKPLIFWSIKSAKFSKEINDVYVSTEDRKITEISKQYDAKVIHRPECLSTDTASLDKVIKHFIAKLNLKDSDIICLLQPTSPLRNSSHISQAINLYKSNNAKMVMSVFEPKYSAYKSYLLEDNGYLCALMGKNYPFTPRQILPKVMQPNGAIYIFRVLDFNDKNQIPRSDLLAFLMSEKYSVDIDTIEDFEIAEKYMKEENNEIS